MLTKDDLQKMRDMIGEMIDQKFEGFEVKYEKRFSTLEQEFRVFREEIKNDVLKFKLDIAKGYDHICTELQIVVGYRQMIEDCQEQIDKLKEPRVMVVI